ADGRPERCLPAHSWNSNHVVSNVFLYHLQRHSDHHAHPTRRYQALRSFDGAPNLPSGDATMILVALVPPLWSRVMDKRVRAHSGDDMSRANLPAHAREALDRAAAADVGASSVAGNGSVGREPATATVGREPAVPSVRPSASVSETAGRAAQD